MFYLASTLLAAIVLLKAIETTCQQTHCAYAFHIVIYIGKYQSKAFVASVFSAALVIDVVLVFTHIIHRTFVMVCLKNIHFQRLSILVGAMENCFRCATSWQGTDMLSSILDKTITAFRSIKHGFCLPINLVQDYLHKQLSRRWSAE